jgi:peptidoglycan/LPS O-acetylase OafA/YrhL
LFHPLHLLDPVSSQGHYAVAFFFLLSGFILSHNYARGYSLREHPKFVYLRFARIWPVHLATLLVTVSTLPGLSLGLCKSLAEELLLVRTWFHSDPAWNTPAWSLSAEWLAYLFLFPPACLLFRRVQSPWLLGAAIGSLLAGICWLPPDFAGRCTPILFLFPAGVALHRISRLVKDPPAELIQNAGFTLVLAYLWLPGRLPELVLYTGFGLLIFGLSYQRGVLARVLSHRFIVFGGLASYSLYMTHDVVMRSYLFFFDAVWMANQPQSIRLLLLLLLLAALAGAAVISYCCLEEPANRGLRRVFIPHRQHLSPPSVRL